MMIATGIVALLFLIVFVAWVTSVVFWVISMVKTRRNRKSTRPVHRFWRDHTKHMWRVIYLCLGVQVLNIIFQLLMASA